MQSATQEESPTPQSLQPRLTYNPIATPRIAFRWIASSCVVILTVLFYLHFVLAYGVNVPYWDDWQLLELIRQVQSGHMNWSTMLVAKHNEHILGAGFVVQALQLLLTDFDYKGLLVTGVFLQVSAFAVIAGMSWRSVPEKSRPFWFVISALIWFTVAQYKDLLWPFQTAWFLITLCLVITLACLSRINLAIESQSRNVSVLFAIAITSALFASFASLQGVIVWLAGIVYLLGCKDFNISAALRGPLRVWLAASAVAGALFLNFWLRGNSALEAGTQPFSFRTFFDIIVGIHGDFWGDMGVSNLLALGLLMLVFVTLALVKVNLSKEKASYALPVALIAFGVFFVVLVAAGRAKFGTGPINDSHYTAYLVMTYFGVLCILLRSDHTVSNNVIFRAGLPLYVVAILLATITSTYNATLRAIDWRSDQGLGAAALLHYRDEPDFVLASQLFGDGPTVRRNAEYLEVHRLCVFGDPKPVPDAVIAYTQMPKGMEVMLTQYPDHRDAIARAWNVYQVGNDLRNAFNPVAPDFAFTFINWCAGASADKVNPHYLSRYFSQYASDYAAIRDAELAKKGTQ